MSTRVMDHGMSANRPPGGRSDERSSELVLLCILALVGIIPFVGLCIVSVWDQAELGFGTLMLLLVTPELARLVRARLKARREGQAR